MTEELTISAEDVLQQVKLSGQLGAVKEAIAFRHIVQNAALENNIEVTPDEIQTAADKFREINHLQRAEDTLAWLQEQELAVEEFELMIKFSILQSKLTQHLFADQVEAYFAAHQLDYTKVALYEVILEDEDLALELFYSLKEKETTFFEVAQKYIQDPELRRKGAYRGILSRLEIRAEISSAVFASNPPQLLKPILSANGVNLIYVDEIMKPQLNPKIRGEILTSLFTDWIKKKS